MVHQETEWLRQSAIDLSRFANRTVTLTLEVAACSNIYSTVHAKAWVDQITIRTRSIWPTAEGWRQAAAIDGNSAGSPASLLGAGAPPARPEAVAAEGQRLVKAGLRFSTKAAMPSFWSSRAKAEWKVRRSKSRPSDSELS
jgi:hypothetical protein